MGGRFDDVIETRGRTSTVRQPVMQMRRRRLATTTTTAQSGRVNREIEFSRSHRRNAFHTHTHTHTHKVTEFHYTRCAYRFSGNEVSSLDSEFVSRCRRVLPAFFFRCLSASIRVLPGFTELHRVSTIDCLVGRV